MQATGRVLSLSAALVVAAFTALFFAWVLTLGFTTPEPFQDFRFHNDVARRLAQGGPLELPHPLYHALVAGLAALGLAPAWAGMTVAVAAQSALALVAFFDLRAADGGRAAVALVAALGLSVAAPLNWFTPATREFYFGYLFPNALHNPTIILLRPLALALFLGCAAALAAGARASAARAGGLALLTVLCALAKPSYVICLLPALAVTWLLDGPRVTPRWVVVVLGVVVPGALLAAVQAWFTLTTDRMEPTTIVFAPLQVVFMHTRRDVALVALKALLSIAFPLAVLAAYGREVWRDQGVRLAWLAFGAGAFYAYGLAESGERMIHGNFLWSGQAATAVLFAASARFTLARARARAAPAAALALCAGVFALHVAAGLAYAWHFARTGEGF
jgi:hypothetical protein